jgi:hypothetical protein
VAADFDAVIDAVAREMTEFEPSGALRARVLERIGQVRRHPSPAVPRWAWAGAAAAVVLAAATAVWMTRPMPAPGDAQATVAEQRTGAPAAAAPGAERPAAQPVGVPAGAASPAGGASAAARTNRATAARGAQAAGADVLQDRHPVPALAEIEPLRFSAVEPEPLQIAAVEVAPFPAMQLIDIPSLGPGSDDIQSVDPKKEK